MLNILASSYVPIHLTILVSVMAAKPGRRSPARGWEVFSRWVVHGSMFLALFCPQEEAPAADVRPIPVCLLQDSAVPGGPVSRP